MRTREKEKRKELSIPWEWVIWQRCKNRGSLPYGGGELNQPHILMYCFDIIDSEHMSYEVDRAEEAKKLKEMNERMASPHIKPPSITG